MVIDSSAVVALVLNEPEAPAIALALARAGGALVGAPTWLEISIVLRSDRIGLSADQLDRAREAWNLELVPFGAPHAAAADDAWRRYGKGNHSARLNFGDCMSYATAAVEGMPLLFVGDDFSQTDIASVL